MKYICRLLKDKTLVLTFILVYFNTSSLVISLNLNLNFYEILKFILFLIFLLIYDYKYKNIKKSSYIIIIYISISILISMDFNGDYSLLNIAIIINIAIGILISNMIKFNKFAECFIKVMIFISLYSILTLYILNPIIDRLGLFSIDVNSAGLVVKNYLFSFKFVEAAYRNTGIFREMGVYQIFLNMALIFEIFFSFSKRRPKIILLFSMTIITTFSTPGIINLIITLSCYIVSFILKNKKEMKNVLILMFITIISFNFLLSNNDQFKKNFENSINKLDNEASSYDGRMASINSNFDKWIERPIIGNAREEAWLISEKYSHITMHNTSTSTLFFAMYGIGFGILMLGIFIKLFNKMKCNKIIRICLFIGIMLSINSQALIHDQLFYILSFSGLMNEV